MKIIRLKGGDTYDTPDSHSVYFVEEGEVFVYLIADYPSTDTEQSGKTARRMYLCEVGQGEEIPGFFSATEEYENYRNWRFLLSAKDAATLSVRNVLPDDKLVMAFAKRIPLQLDAPEQFGVELKNHYDMTRLAEELLIFKTKKEQQDIREESLRQIYRLFVHEEVPSKSGKISSKDLLYNAAAYLCRREKIAIADIERIKDCAGYLFTLPDISRVSHFIVREIVLEDGWHQSDSGALLAFWKKNNHPVVCVPKGVRHYTVYDPETQTTVRLTDQIAAELKSKGYMFYRPFPEKAMKAKDLFLFGFQKVYKSDLLRLFLLALLGTAVGLLIPFLNEQAYDRFIPIGDDEGLLGLGAVLLACSIGNVTFSIVKNLSAFRSMNAMEYAAQSATLDRLFNLPESFYRDYDAANLGMRALGVSVIFNVLAQSATTSVLSALFSLLYLWRMYHYSKQLARTALILLAAVLAVLLYIGIRQTKYEGEKLKVDYEAQSNIFQFLSGISKIRIAGAEERALLQYIQKFIEARKINTKKEHMTIIVNTVASSVQILFSIVFFYLMVNKDINLSIGAFTGFTAAFGSFSGAMLTIVQNFLDVNRIKPIYDDAKPILETLPENSGETAAPGKIQGEIEMSNVTFSYKAGEATVIKNLSLHIRPGEYIGVVGSSGCGKSTLLKLLLGFEKPQIGKIYYDSRDIEEVDKRELRKKFGVVLQDGGLISGSIYDNITITAPNCEMSRVEEVVREVGLADDIKAMPMGLHTVISENSGTISGGQMQRILIARAIVGNPKVIFLDEATSALDNVTQNQVVETLEKLNATKIVIAHRLSTVQKCDRIIVMDAGTIAEQGTYQELMDKHGLFYNLAIRQIS